MARLRTAPERQTLLLYVVCGFEVYRNRDKRTSIERRAFILVPEASLSSIELREQRAHLNVASLEGSNHCRKVPVVRAISLYLSVFVSPRGDKVGGDRT